MFFGDLQSALCDNLRRRVQNGEITERALARLVGISQPHIHNVLKGARILSPALADEILRRLRISVYDLLDPVKLRGYVAAASAPAEESAWIPILEGRLGPGYAWPSAIARYECFPVSAASLAAMTSPVVVALGADSRMAPLFETGDLALLDQSRQARADIDPEALYVVKQGEFGCIRRLRASGRSVYIVPEDSVDRPVSWARIPAETAHVAHIVRARATLIGRTLDWPRSQ
jgi:hypothetical protein